MQSKNEQVREWLNNLKIVNHQQFELLNKARSIVLDCHSNAEEKIMYGGIIFFAEKEMFAGLFSYSNHVSIEFSKGFQMEDPKGILEGKGKYRRHIKMQQPEDIIIKGVLNFVKQAL